MLDLTDDIIDQRAEQQAEERFSTYIDDGGNVYTEPDGGPDDETESDGRRREDYLELYVVEAPVECQRRSVAAPVRRAFGRVPRRAAVKSVAAAGDSDSEPHIGSPSSLSLQVTREASHVS